MALPDSYTLKPDTIPAYFDAILDAEAPERFSLKFLENLGFTATNDRLLIGVLKDLGFLNRDGQPQPRYFSFLDRGRSKQVVAEAIRESFSDLYALYTKAHELSVQDVRNKLRTLYAGKKTDLVISRIAKTFKALTEYADFSTTAPAKHEPVKSKPTEPKVEQPIVTENGGEKPVEPLGRLQVSSLQYQINIVLPDSRDQAVYDAIFRSLREHLG